MNWQMMSVQGKSLSDLSVLALCAVSSSWGKVPGPNEGKICPFPFPPLGEVLTTPKRRWEIHTENTCSGVELELPRPIPAQCICLWVQGTSPARAAWEANFLQPSCFSSLSGHQSSWVRAASSTMLGQHLCECILEPTRLTFLLTRVLSNELKDQNQIFYCSVITDFHWQIWSQPSRWKCWK